MTIRATITKAGRSDTYGIPLVVGNTYTLSDEYGTDLIFQGFARDTDGVLATDSPSDFIPYSYAPANPKPNRYLGIYGLSVVIGLGVANNALTAAVNTALIQAALTAGGLVQILAPGVYYINNSLVIPSNTTLQMSTGVVLRRFAGSFDYMLVTKAYNDAATAVTMAWTNGQTATVGWTAHGKSVGDMVSIAGSSAGAPSQLNGTFRISAVNNANSFDVRLRRIPTAAPSGTWTGRTTTVNFKVIGGEFDYNIRGGSAPSTSIGNMCMVLFYCQNYLVDNVSFRDVPKYCIFTGNFADGKVTRMSGETNSDGCHTRGPAFNMEIDGVYGSYGDDICAASVRDVQGVFTDISWGDILGYTARHINGTSNIASPCQVYSYAGYVLDDVEFDTINGGSGASPAMLRIYDDQVNGGGTINKITLKNCSALGAINIAPYNGGTVPFTIQELIIDSCNYQAPTDLTQLFVFSQYVTIKSLTVRNLISNTAFGTSGAVNLFNLAGNVENITLENSRLVLGGSCRVFGWSAASGGLKQLTISRCSIDGGNSLVNKASTVTDAPRIVLENSYIKNMFDVFALSSNADVVMTGNVFDTIGGAVAHIYNAAATAANFWEVGNTYSSAPRMVAAAGVYNPKTFDCQVDIGATGVVKVTNGNMCFNTGAARGTITQNRLVTCNGTQWSQLDTPANVF